MLEPLIPNRQDDAEVLLWLGETEPALDVPEILECGHAVLGIYGGNTRAGARKNEDGAFVLTDANGEWEFAVLLDAHYSAESARLVLELINQKASTIREMLQTLPVGSLFRQLEDYLANLFASPEFLEQTQHVYGEASCLISARKGAFIWWMSIGDCLAYLFHPHLASRGQFALNQRTFFEWIGFRNTFNLPVPCYASGVKELREGRNVICLATDGVFEGDEQIVLSDVMLYRTYMSDEHSSLTLLREQTLSLLREIHRKKGRDSATMIVWDYVNRHAD